MAANDAELRIGANIDDLKAATDKAAGEVKKMADQMQSSLGTLNSAFQKINGTFMAFTAALAGGSAFKAVINASNEWAGDSGKLAKSLGTTVEQASVMKVALTHLGIESDVMVSASQKMSKQIFSNGAAFETMGIQVKDSTGHYRPVLDIMGEANQKLAAIKNPIEQNIAGMQLYGKSWGEVKPILKLTSDAMAEAEQRAKELHLVVGQEGEAAAKAYKEQMRDLNLVGKSLEVQFGSALTPVFVTLGSLLSSVMPVASEVMATALQSLSNVVRTLWDTISGFVGVVFDGFSAVGKLIVDTIGVQSIDVMELFRNVLKLVEMAFVGFQLATQLAMESVKAILESVVDRLLRFADAASHALLLDFSGAKAAWATGTKIIEDTQQQHWDNLVKIAEAGQVKLDAIAMRGTDGAAKGSGKKAVSGNDPTYDFAKEGSSSGDKSRMGLWESKLAEAKVFYQKNNELREYSKQQELDYWQNILATARVSGQERIAVTRKVAEVELEMMKRDLQQRKAMESEAVNAKEKAMMDGITAEQAVSEREMQLGNITKQQMLQLEQQYEDRRFDIQVQAQQARISAMQGDPNMDPVALQKLLDQLAEIQRAHALRTTQMQTRVAVENKNRWEETLAPISNAFEKSITGMIQGTTTWRKAMSNIFNSILGEFMSMVTKMVVKWAAGEIAKTTATQSNSGLRALLEKMGLLETVSTQEAASGEIVATKGEEAMAVVGDNAAEAASGAAASAAAIPYVGWAMAAAAFAGVLGMVLGAKSSIKSASQGYDIPAGVNPMTQLHEQEMVLPAEHANAIRAITAGGAMGSNVHLHVHSPDVKGVRDWFRGNAQVLAPALRRAARNGFPSAITAPGGRVY